MHFSICKYLLYLWTLVWPRKIGRWVWGKRFVLVGFLFRTLKLEFPHSSGFQVQRDCVFTVLQIKLKLSAAENDCESIKEIFCQLQIKLNRKSDFQFPRSKKINWPRGLCVFRKTQSLELTGPSHRSLVSNSSLGCDSHLPAGRIGCMPLNWDVTGSSTVADFLDLWGWVNQVKKIVQELPTFVFSMHVHKVLSNGGICRPN